MAGYPGANHYKKMSIQTATPQQLLLMLYEGAIQNIKKAIDCMDRKDLSAYIERHNRYSTWEASMRASMLSGGGAGLHIKADLFGNSQERRRALKQIAIRMPFEPAAWFLYHFVGRLGFLEGRRGLIAAQIRSQYIAQVRAKMYEASLQPPGRAATPHS